MSSPCRLTVLQALAWRLVAELYRRHAAAQTLSLLEMHPGISMWGQLRLIVGPSDARSAEPASITFNFGGPSGTCEVRRGGAEVLGQFDYVSPMLNGDPAEVVDRLESSLGLKAPAKIPPSSAAVLGVRLVADALGREWLARTTLRATLGWVDSSMACWVPDWTKAFGADLTKLGPQVSSDAMPSQDAHAQLSGLVALHDTTDGAPLLHADRPYAAIDLNQGRVALGKPGKAVRHIALKERYQADGRRLGPVVDELLKHLGR